MENSNRVRVAGTLYAVGGALWLCWIMGFSLLNGEVPGPDAALFSLTEVGFIIIQCLLFAGFLGIWWSRGVGDGVFGKIAFGLGLLGHFLFILAEITLLAASSEIFLPPAALSSAFGLLLTGVAVLRTNRWQGWSRYAPLLAGLYPFVGMFPFLVITGGPSEIAIGLWGLFRLLLGLTIRQQASQPFIRESPAI